jgi:hypothetical protein
MKVDKETGNVTQQGQTLFELVRRRSQKADKEKQRAIKKNGSRDFPSIILNPKTV